MAGHLLELCNTSFSNAYLDSWVDHYSALAAKTGYAPDLKSWIGARRTFVLNQLATDWPATAFAITTNGGADFSINAPTATLTGTGWIDVHRIRKAGAVEPLDLVWLDGATWQVVVPLGAGATTISLEALSPQGAITGTDSIVITNTGPTVPAAAGNLSVSEIMYHPANPTAAEIGAGFTDADDFEFIELLNPGANPVDLAEAAFTLGITYTFPAATLAPGARLVLVRDAAAFASRHPGVTVFGIYTDKLGNGGERLLLLDRAGVPILDFTYGDSPPWPAEADGAGFSLTLRNPAAPSAAASWRVSVGVNGSAGANDALNPASYPTLLDYALAALPSVTIEAGYATFTWSERIGSDGATITPQLSTDLAAWQDGSAFIPLSNVVNLDGTRTLRLRSATPAAAAGREFFRLRVEVQ